MTEAEVRAAIAAYAKLEAHADVVAMKVLETRGTYWMPRQGELEIEIDETHVFGSWRVRGDNESVSFPTEFLWLPMFEVVDRTVEMVRDEQALAEQRKVDEAAAQERRDRAQYEHLKARFGI